MNQWSSPSAPVDVVLPAGERQPPVAEVLRAADPDKPRLGGNAAAARCPGTTRLAEHWAHAWTSPALGIPYPTRRACGTSPGSVPHPAYAFELANEPFAPVRAELTGPDGRRGATPDDADSVISGPVGAFCRVGAQRVARRSPA